jgi:hypothetical protein
MDKTIGNNRKYIIALCLIRGVILSFPKGYLKYMKRRGDNMGMYGICIQNKWR